MQDSQTAENLTLVLTTLKHLLGPQVHRLRSENSAQETATSCCYHLHGIFVRSGPEERARIVAALEPAPDAGTLERLYRQIALLTVTRSARHVDEILDLLLSGYDPEAGWADLSPEQVLFQLWQFIYGFWQNAIEGGPGPDTWPKLRRTYGAAVECYRKVCGPDLEYIPFPERNRQLVVVLTNQMLPGMHQPTIDIQEYCEIIKSVFGLDVILMNTADPPTEPLLPMSLGALGNYHKDLSEYGAIACGDAQIPFVQLSSGITTMAEAYVCARQIAAGRPLLVLSFGGTSPVADLCRLFTDVVAIPFGTYLPIAEPTLFGLPRAVGDSDRQMLAQIGLGEQDVVNMHYAYSLPETGSPRTRAELGIPADAIAVAVCGMRLDTEVTEAFAAGLETVLADVPEAFFVFVGNFARYGQVAAAHPALAARSVWVGFTPDVRAVYAVCDAYANPPRGGGGASAAYAIADGVPAYTFPWGDVSVVVGPDFHVPDYAGLATALRRLRDEPAYREDMRAKAKAQYATISSREHMLRQLMDSVITCLSERKWSAEIQQVTG